VPKVAGEPTEPRSVELLAMARAGLLADDGDAEKLPPEPSTCGRYREVNGHFASTETCPRGHDRKTNSIYHGSEKIRRCKRCAQDRQNAYRRRRRALGGWPLRSR
jgi:hypothetical protein